MFRNMRRNKQLLSETESIEILTNGISGVLALAGDNGYPYAVPLNYIYFDSAIWFHCATNGHKIDAVKQCNKASFCIVSQQEIISEKFTSKYRSVVVFGKIAIIEDKEIINNAIRKLSLKYCSNQTNENTTREIDEFKDSLCIIKLTPEHITGKRSLI